MHRVWKQAIVAALLLAPAPPAPAQFNPYAPQQNMDARLRRAWREQAVAYAGVAARGLVETEGDHAVAAIFACSPAGARKLVEFHVSGALNKLPRPQQLLQAIAQPGAGDDAVFFAVQHQSELADPDCLTAYCADPVTYALGMRPLAEGAAEVRARHLAAQPGTASGWDWRKLAILAGGVGLVGLLLWWRRSRQLA